jgi:hypothetical protein
MVDDGNRVTEMSDEADASRGIGGFAAGVVFGVFLGAGVALMFAPERGDKTRRRLRRRLQQLREDTADGLERAGSRTRRDLARRKRRLEAGLERAAERARDAI